MARTSLHTTALVATLALGIGAAPAAHAAGFLIYDLSGEALGKGSAVSASTTEPAAVFFNPAALAFMPGVQASVGSVVIHNRKNFEPETGAKVNGKPGTFVLPSAFVTGQITSRLALGFGVYPAFGLAIKWPSDWLGKEFGIDAKVETVDINPTAAVTIIEDKLSLAGGYNLVRGAVDFTQGLGDALGGTARIGGSTYGQGWNAALLYRPLPNVFHAAFSYRSRVKLNFNDGRVDFDPAPEFAKSLPDQRGRSRITLPDIFTLGLMWRPTPRLTLNFDPQYVLWSTYDELKLDFETAPDKTLVRKSKNVFTLRAGADWQTPWEGFTLRGGLIFDQNPAPKQYLAPSLPDANRIDVGLGVGYTRGWLRADLGYLLVYFLPSKATGGLEGPVGTYNTVAHLLGLTLTARFGAGAATR